MMPKPILALCDSDKEYIQQLAQYLRRQSDLWEVRTYFGVSELRKDAEEASPRNQRQKKNPQSA